MDSPSLTLTPRELTITVLALREFRRSILENEDDHPGDDLDDLLLIESALRKLDDARKSLNSGA
jgi:hypothetical protein